MLKEEYITVRETPAQVSLPTGETNTCQGNEYQYTTTAVAMLLPIPGILTLSVPANLAATEQQLPCLPHHGQVIIPLRQGPPTVVVMAHGLMSLHVHFMKAPKHSR